MFFEQVNRTRHDKYQTCLAQYRTGGKMSDPRGFFRLLICFQIQVGPDLRLPTEP